MELDALATENVANRSAMLTTVLSKPVPTAGAVSGMRTVPTPSVVVAGAFSEAREIHLATPRPFAEVLAPIARHVYKISKSHVVLVCAVTLSAEVPLVNAAILEVGPRRRSKVMLPGVVATVDMRPLALSRSCLP